jgi:RNA polymerase sigma-70 factor (ECF subfamily)
LTPGPAAELELARACARGDDAAWEELGRRYFDFIRGLAARYLPGPSGLDVADQGIADLWQRRKIGRFEGRSSLRTWLGAVVIHAALNARKTERRLVELDPEALATTARAVAPATERSRLSDILGEAIARLGTEERLLVRLHYEQGLTLEAMEPVFRLSKAALSRRLKNTRESVRRSMEELCRERHRASLDDIRRGVDFADWDFDLDALLERGQRIGPRTVKEVRT